MKVTWQELDFPGLCWTPGATFRDDRGSLSKVFSGGDPSIEDFTGHEVFWTESEEGVLRGLHFQLPPHATRKLVFVVSGAIRDFVVDLRVGSPTQGQSFEMEMTPESGALLIPAGLAHAYESLRPRTIVCYVQDVPFCDEASYSGIRLDSAGFVPTSASPIVSDKDRAFPRLSDFQSPFIYPAG